MRKQKLCLMANENTQESRVSIEVMVKKNLISGPSDALTKIRCNIYLNEQSEANQFER